MPEAARRSIQPDRRGLIFNDHNKSFPDRLGEGISNV
jgi:hypothetical protein